MSQNEQMPDIEMSADELYKEETFTDRKIGSIRRLTPVTRDGEVDSGRSTLFNGNTQVYTPAGALPLSFDLDVDSLEAAVEAFPEAAKKALDETMEELRRMQRDQASSIMVPGQGQGGGMGGGGGSSIQMP